MHPESFSAFVDLDGQLGPNAATMRQTIARLLCGGTVRTKIGPGGECAGYGVAVLFTTLA